MQTETLRRLSKKNYNNRAVIFLLVLVLFTFSLFALEKEMIGSREYVSMEALSGEYGLHAQYKGFEEFSLEGSGLDISFIKGSPYIKINHEIYNLPYFIIVAGQEVMLPWRVTEYIGRIENQKDIFGIKSESSMYLEAVIDEKPGNISLECVREFSITLTIKRPDISFFEFIESIDDNPVIKDVSIYHNNELSKITIDLARNKGRLFCSLENKGNKTMFYIHSSGKKFGNTTPVKVYTIKRILLDPGHGGKDPGAVSGSLQEKDIVLKLAKYTRELLLDKLPGVEVFMTRDTDEFLPLRSRVEMANDLEADLFISFHINASRSQKVKGVSVYFLSAAKNEEDRETAELENASVKYEEEPEYDLSSLDNILSDIIQSENLEESSDLSTFIQGSLIDAKPDFIDLGVRQAGFFVLYGATMPAVLLETGFITNSKDAKILKSNNNLKKLANSIVSGIMDYKETIEKIGDE